MLNNFIINSLNNILEKSPIEQKKEERPLFKNGENVNNKKDNQNSMEGNSLDIKPIGESNKENNNEVSQIDKIKMINNYINSCKDSEIKKINKEKKIKLVDNSENNNDNNFSNDEMDKEIPKIKNYRNNGYYFNYKINNNIIKEQIIQNPSFHKNKINKNRNRNSSIDNQINANHNMIKRLFRQNKKNNSKIGRAHV